MEIVKAHISAQSSGMTAYAN